ncbi:enoyl-CoA hydratase [Alicyclobacillaceae bacterium I2511]|nr:enoyl-CoA hydratase [Alicyclobacillaceae bacterium I2511]
MWMADLLVKQKDAILEITLNRPQSLNAFSVEMIEDLTGVVREAQMRQDVRALVVSGAGRSFSTGGDVKTMGNVSPVHVYEHVGKLNACILAMQALNKPIIAAVHGFAAGAGFNLAMACDLIVAAEDSQIVLSFAQVGLISDGGGSYFLPRLVGLHIAKEWLFLADPIPAQRAFELGIVNRIVPASEVQTEAMKLAQRLADGPSLAFGMMKKILNSSFPSSLADVLEAERTAQAMMVTTADHLEGVRAFQEKRHPKFQGK